MPKNTDAQRRRKRDAVFSACFYSALTILSGILCLVIRQHFGLTGLAGAVLLIAFALDMEFQIPIWIILKIRLKEIEGGEEDAAAQY